MSSLSPPKLLEFSFAEKMAFERLFAKFGKSWKQIASYFLDKTAMDVKRYWVQKSRRENILREELALRKPAEMTVHVQGTKIYIRKNASSPFSWKLTPVEKNIPSDLEILANVAASLSN